MSTKNPSAIQPIHLTLLAIASAGLFFIWMWPGLNNKPEPTTPVPEQIALPPQAVPIADQPKPVAEQPKPVAAPLPIDTPSATLTATPEPVLPSLNNSDAAVKAELAKPQFSAISKLLTNEYYIRKIVRAVVAASSGQWVNQHRPLVPPKTLFNATQQGSKITTAEANYTRYTPYIQALENIGSQNIAALYSRYLPLLQDAYAELGLKDKTFHEVTLKALDTMTSAPQDFDAELIHPSVMFKFKDKQLEGLPEIQKLLLRIGPENQRRLKIVLNDVRASIK